MLSLEKCPPLVDKVKSAINARVNTLPEGSLLTGVALTIVPRSPQKHHPTSCSNFFEPVFVVQPAKDVLDSVGQAAGSSFSVSVLASNGDLGRLAPGSGGRP